jgi:hypothetical protein
MDRYQPRRDTDYWNLDALEFWKSGKIKGTADIRVINDNLGRVGRIAFLPKPSNSRSSDLLLIRPEAGIIQRIPLSDSEKITEIHNDDKELIDIAGHENHLYVLTRQDDKFVVTQYRANPARLLPNKKWFVETNQLLPTSRIRITSGQQSKLAFIGPCRDGHMLSVELSDSLVTRDLFIRIGDGEVKLDPEIDFCIDSRKGTLIITDTRRHRVLEADFHSGAARIICGGDKAGDAAEEEVARRAALNYPKAVVIYRPAELVREALLSQRSLSFLRDVAYPWKPRTILVADAGNFKVKKFVELAGIAAHGLAASTEPFLYTLLGSGKESTDKAPRFPKKNVVDLRQCSIPEPTALTVSDFGELVIGCRSNRVLICLRPASALSDEKVAQVSDDIHISK